MRAEVYQPVEKEVAREILAGSSMTIESFAAFFDAAMSRPELAPLLAELEKCFFKSPEDRFRPEGGTNWSKEVLYIVRRGNIAFHDRQDIDAVLNKAYLQMFFKISDGTMTSVDMRFVRFIIKKRKTDHLRVTTKQESRVLPLEFATKLSASLATDPESIVLLQEFLDLVERKLSEREYRALALRMSGENVGDIEPGRSYKSTESLLSRTREKVLTLYLLWQAGDVTG